MKKRILISLDDSVVAKLDSLGANRSLVVSNLASGGLSAEDSKLIKTLEFFGVANPISAGLKLLHQSKLDESGYTVKCNRQNVERMKELKEFESDSHAVNYALVVTLAELEQKVGKPKMNEAMAQFVGDDPTINYGY